MFDVSSFLDPRTRPFFLKFIAQLKESCDQALPSPTHKFFKMLADRNLLLRGYTQNIDDMERKAGLAVYSPGQTDTPSSSIIKCVGTKRRESLNSSSSRPVIIPLHGSLQNVVCTVCRHKSDFDNALIGAYKNGEAVECKQCKQRSEDRAMRGRRRLQSGFYRPDIVLYNEHHHMGDLISEFVSLDVESMPTTVIVMGTSLRVAGLKRLVKDMAKSVQRKREIAPDRCGPIIFVNKTPASKGEWRNVFDAEFLGTCDGWVESVVAEMARLEIGRPRYTIVSPSPSQTKITNFFKTRSKSTVNKTKTGGEEEGNEDTLFDQQISQRRSIASKC